MNINKRRLAGVLGVLVALCLVVGSLGTPVLAQPPPMNHQFYGDVTSQGDPVDEGVSVVAKVKNGEPCGSTTVYIEDAKSKYNFEVSGEVASPGDPIEFYVDNVKAALYDVEAGEWLDSYSFGTSYYRTELDLRVPGVTYALTMAALPEIGGTATDVTNASPYEEGASVSIKAEAAALYQFVNWTATAGTFLAASEAETTFTMPGEAATVTANFALIGVTYDLTMVAEPEIGGTATDVTNASPYAEGASVSIKAEAAALYQFVNWTAPAGVFLAASEAETTFTMPGEAATVTANFELIPPPVAGFSASVQAGDEPLTVVFTDESLNMADSPTWSWDFGDEGTSTDQNPTHQYLQDGSYTVSLTVTTDAGTDDEVKADYIMVANTIPVASFTAEPTSGDYPLEVSFTDTSTSHDGITSWQWDFSYQEELGFNIESTVQHPVYPYLTEGTHTVVLKVIEADWNSNMMVAEDLITVTAPTPPTVVSTTPEAGATDVPIDVVVSATFDEDITLVVEAGVTIVGSKSGPLGGVQVELAGGTLTIGHDDFASNEEITVTIAAGVVQDLVSNPNDEYTWSFTSETITFTITPTAGAGGSIEPSAVVEVAYGGSETFTIIPDTGYEIADVLVDGVSVGAVDTYTFTNVTVAHTIDATFTPITFTITATAGDNGTISPSGPVVVDYGGEQLFTITPNEGYEIAEVLIDGVSIPVVPHLVNFTNVVADRTIHATFASVPVSFTVALSAGWNLLSTPIKLDADSDALEQIFDAQSLANIEISYRWDTVSQQWAIPTGYELSPLEAVYLKVSSGTSATAEFTPSQELSWLPSRELQPGLNLIGPAPALEAGVFPAMPLDQALISIAEAEGGLRGYTMVVSPAHNQLGWAYALGGEIKDLIPFKGYWVVMENADTLYGFSTTPIE